MSLLVDLTLGVRKWRSFLPQALGSGLLLLLLGNLVVDWMGGGPFQMQYDSYRPLPRKATVSSILKDQPQVQVTRKINAYKPTSKSGEKIERQFSLDLDKVDLLTVVDLPASEYGSRGAVTLDSNGDTTVTVVPNRPPIASLGGRWGFGGGLVADSRNGMGGSVLLEKQVGTLFGYRGRVLGTANFFKNGEVDVRAHLILSGGR